MANIRHDGFALEGSFRLSASCRRAYFLENRMKKLAIALLALGGLLSGCVAYEVPGRNTGARPGDRDRDGIANRADRDRDGDGVPNRHDSRPNDPRRY
jgi:hypothetical protein